VLVFVILAIFGALAIGVVGHAYVLLESIQDHRAQLDAYYVGVSAEALRLRMTQTGSLGTVTLASLTSADEGFKVKGVDADRLYLASATNISDGSWRFDRALIYALSDLGDRNWDPLLAANNSCSTVAFATAASWCGPTSDVVYHLIETRETYLPRLTDEAMRMQFTLQKLARGYSVVETDTFPRGAITAGSSAQICTTGGGTCMNTSCMSPVVLQQTPLDCADQFSRWGAPVVLNLVSAKHVALATTATTVRRAAGTSRRVARELRVP
jgi:hypothetical protein